MAKNTSDKSPSVRGFDDLDKVVTLAGELTINVESSTEELLDRGIKKTNSALRLVVEAGVNFLMAKSKVPHGEFEKLIKKKGVSSQRVSEAMNMARFAAKLPAKQRNSMLSMHKTKAQMLAHTDPEVIENLVDEDTDGQFEEINALSVRDLRNRIRQLEAQNADLDIELDTVVTREKALKNKVNKQLEHSEYPGFVVAARHESNALSDKALLCFDDIERLINEMAHMHEAGLNTEHVSMAVATITIHVRSLMSKSAQLIQQLQASGIELPPLGDFPSKLQYTDDEIVQAISDRRLMVDDLRQEALIREDEREAKKPRKRGAPKKLRAKQ